MKQNHKNINWPADNYLTSQQSAPVTWSELHGSARGLALSQLLDHKQPYLIITDNNQTAQKIYEQIQTFAQKNLDSDKTLLRYFPGHETLPYDPFSPHPEIISKRIDLLNKLPTMTAGITIITAANLLRKLPPTTYLQQLSYNLHVKQKITQEQIIEKLHKTGYQRVDQVTEHGQFSIRGAIIDFYATGSELPLRIELSDDIIESLRYFDPETQRSIKKITATGMQAAREYPLDENAITTFRSQWRESFPGLGQRCPIYKNISEGRALAGIEYYLPLFFPSLDNFFSYLPSNTTCIKIGNISESMLEQNNMLTRRYEQLNIDPMRPLCAPDTIYLTTEYTIEHLNKYPQITINNEKPSTDNSQINFASKKAPDLHLNLRDKQPMQPLFDFLENKSLQLIISCNSAGREQTIQDLLKSSGKKFTHIKDWYEINSKLQDLDTIKTNQIFTTTSDLTEGLWLTHRPILLLSENELFANFIPQKRLRTHKNFDMQQQLTSLQKLAIGDPVVHRDHGIGRYLGLETLNNNGEDTECMVIEYADAAKIYVPTQSMDVISRYIGMDPENVSIQKLGRSAWQKSKDKALTRIRDLAAELLTLYSKRQTQTGFKFSEPDHNYKEFCAAFPFEETYDQQKAINDIINDMCSARCMDRLICGDVGFGKTEVAMRAAFLAVNDAKQVAILVPTTLLAQQHHRTLIDRFIKWPIKISCLTRLNTAKQQEAQLQELKLGKIDIIISTHKLLHQELPFKNLGLLIIDEEHRFGVKQKDRLKKIRIDVDILAMTATPIPRTLNQAMIGTRDLSIIATPPPERSSIQTFIKQYEPKVIKEAITRELQRGGQVYYLHNKVNTIAGTCDKIKSWLPEAEIRYAHGQMNEGQLEAIMRDFYNQQFNILVATTIIESGIDIPSANTIIIERADRFGLSELHQIRGRVGRSHHQAYAYLLTPSELAITTDAKKRLNAIASCKSLGAGFNLASEDLEIRGAGELLGDKQSGQILTIGFSLYLEMLQHTIKKLQNGEIDANQDVLKNDAVIDLPIASLIPENYIHDIPLRLEVYKRLCNCNTTSKLREIKSELADRFGLIPNEVKNLFNIHQLRIIATPLGVKKIEGSKRFIYYKFNQKNKINHLKIMQLIQKPNSEFSLQNNFSLRQEIANDIGQQVDATDRYISIINDLLTLLAES